MPLWNANNAPEVFPDDFQILFWMQFFTKIQMSQNLPQARFKPSLLRGGLFGSLCGGQHVSFDVSVLIGKTTWFIESIPKPAMLKFALSLMFFSCWKCCARTDHDHSLCSREQDQSLECQLKDAELSKQKTHSHKKSMHGVIKQGRIQSLNANTKTTRLF